MDRVRPKRRQDNRAELRDRILELENQCNNLRLERDEYHKQLEHTKHELGEIHQSKMWRFWMASIAVRQRIRHPLRSGSDYQVRQTRLHPDSRGGTRNFFLETIRHSTKLSARLLRALSRGAGQVYLFFWSSINRTTAGLRRKSSPQEVRDERLGDPATNRREYRPRVLIVSPYSIFPPNHGGGARLFNLIKETSAWADIFLLVFSLNGEDEEQRKALAPYCARVDFHKWIPRKRDDWLGLDPPGAQLFRSTRVSQKIKDIVLGFGIDVVQLEYTELGQYRKSVPEGVPVILTEIDLAFRSFHRRRQRGFHKRYPEGNSFGSSAADLRRLFRYEVQACREVDQVHTMSLDDASHLSRFLADGGSRIRVVPNGVDTTSFEHLDERSLPEDLLYVGNYHHLPNVDALEYLVRDIWPLIRLRRNDVQLNVVGANPSDRVTRLGGKDGITVVGPVDDIRDAYRSHRVMLAPIRAGSGTRLKILEAFASGIPVISTSVGAEGINADNGIHLLIADTAVEFAEATIRLLEDEELRKRLSAAAQELVRSQYDWGRVAESLRLAYMEVTQKRDSLNSSASMRRSTPLNTVGPADPQATEHFDVSIVMPTLNGGSDLEGCLEAISRQRTSRSFQIICVDSGSKRSDIETMERHGATVVSIDQREFNHGLTRDYGASLADCDILVFLNQDAIPQGEEWLESLVSPFDMDDGTLAAVQGGIEEQPASEDRFYWDSCGDRFYFTRESRRWLAHFAGVGLSTVNCAIKREVWSRFPFGWAPIMEDKKWQREITEAGLKIVLQQPAVVRHSHNYDVRGLFRRCSSEGLGWRMLGESYSLLDATRDVTQMRVWQELMKGVRSKKIHSAAEFMFPCVRPFALWWGNHIQSGVLL